MKNKIFKIIAVILAAIFVFAAISVSAAPSIEKINKDYRNMNIYTTQGAKVNKPTAQFAANRIVNGEVADMVISYADYDCNTEFPTLICYVGDTLTFTDMSRANNGGNIIEWDWQYFGALGNSSSVYNNNIVNETSFILNEPGDTTFFLCVRNDAKVKNGCCDPWSENGNHQTVGRNKWFPTGAYWYFTAIRVIVMPTREAGVNIRCWDAPNNQIFYEGYVSAGKIYNDDDVIDTSFHITDWDGYDYIGWNVQLPDGTIQYSGDARDVEIALAGWLPQKYLNIEYIPRSNSSLEVRYWDKIKNTIISSSVIDGGNISQDGESIVSVDILSPAGYRTDGWNVQLPDGTIQYEGTEQRPNIILTANAPKKILNVKCYPINNQNIEKKVTVNYIDTKTEKVIKSKVENITTEKQTEIVIESIPDYTMVGWALKTPDGIVEKEGTGDSVYVEVTNKIPHKILEVMCTPDSGDRDDKPDEGDEFDNPPPVIENNEECDGTIRWTETDSHRVFVGYDDNGNRRYKRCYHKFTYEAKLDAETEITPDVLKSGYGFGVNIECTLDTSLVNNDGCRNWGINRKPSETVKDPTTATVYIPWDMTNRLGSQGRSISMVSNGTLKFTLPASPVSEIGAKKIYTPVELAGTKESPQSHSFEIYIGGGGVGSVEFCQKLNGTITINGDMYEDDFSGAD